MNGPVRDSVTVQYIEPVLGTAVGPWEIITTNGPGTGTCSIRVTAKNGNNEVAAVQARVAKGQILNALPAEQNPSSENLLTSTGTQFEWFKALQIDNDIVGKTTSDQLPYATVHVWAGIQATPMDPMDWQQPILRYIKVHEMNS